MNWTSASEGDLAANELAPVTKAAKDAVHHFKAVWIKTLHTLLQLTFHLQMAVYGSLTARALPRGQNGQGFGSTYLSLPSQTILIPPCTKDVQGEQGCLLTSCILLSGKCLHFHKRPILNQSFLDFPQGLLNFLTPLLRSLLMFLVLWQWGFLWLLH